MGEDLYELPKSWVWVKLEDICQTTSGGTPSRKDISNFNGSIPWLKSGELENGIIKATEEFITEKGLTNSSTKIIPKGTLLIALYGATVGRLGILGIDSAINQAICAIFTPEKLCRKYLFFYLINHRDFLLKSRKGGAQPNINQQIINDIIISLPPFNEQNRIVTKIEELFTQLDAGVDLLKKVKAKLKRYRQSILKAAVEGNLTKEWRKAHQDELEPASVLLDRILKQRREKWEAEQLAKMEAQGKTPKDDSWKLKYKEAIAPDISDLPDLPDGWCYTFLKPCLCLLRGMKTGPFGSLLKKHEHQQEGIPVLGIENITTMKFTRGSNIYITKKKAEELSSYDVQPRDIIVSRSGTVGEVCVIPDDIGEARLSTNLMRISLVPQSLSPVYFCLLFNGSPYVLGQVSELCKGSTRDFLNQDILSSIIFPIPSFLEQEKIIEEVERLFSVTDQLEKTINTNLKRAERLRQSILKQAFTGKLVPQDPNDEPAEKLLERIKAEKAARETNKKSQRTTKKR